MINFVRRKYAKYTELNTNDKDTTLTEYLYIFLSHDFSRFLWIQYGQSRTQKSADEHVLAQKNSVVFWNSHVLYHKKILIMEHVMKQNVRKFL